MYIGVGIVGLTLAQLTQAIRRKVDEDMETVVAEGIACLLYTSPSPRDKRQSRMPSSA